MYMSMCRECVFQKSTLGVLSCSFCWVGEPTGLRVLPAIGSASGLLESQVFVLEKQALH